MMNRTGVLKYIVKRGHKKNLFIESSNPMYEYGTLNNDPSVIVDYGSGKTFETQGSKSGEWLQIKINRYYIIPFSYRIKTFGYEAGKTHLKQWNLLASNDNKTFVTIDSISSDALNSQNAEQTFELNEEKVGKTPFSYFRIVCLLNHQGGYRLSLREFDINGVVYSNLIYSNRIKNSRDINIMINLIITLIS